MPNTYELLESTHECKKEWDSHQFVSVSFMTRFLKEMSWRGLHSSGAQATLWSLGCYFVTSLWAQIESRSPLLLVVFSLLTPQPVVFAEQWALKLPVCFHTISQNCLTSGKIFRHLEPEKELPDALSHFNSFEAPPPFSSFLKASVHLQHSVHLDSNLQSGIHPSSGVSQARQKHRKWSL